LKEKRFLKKKSWNEMDDLYLREWSDLKKEKESDERA